jgi:pyrrolidone-carboxylate peptidase
MVIEKLVIGAFQPFGGKSVNNAAEVAERLKDMRADGSLSIPDGVDVSVLPVEVSEASVRDFVAQAKAQGADKVLIMGESGFDIKVEERAIDRGKPKPLLLSAVTHFLPDFGEHDELHTNAPVFKMAEAAGGKVSTDAGNYYCNYSYHTALDAGLNAVFVHVPSGVMGVGRNTEAAAEGVNRLIGAWYQNDPNGPLVMTDR